jgi:hypothetical protein
VVAFVMLRFVGRGELHARETGTNDQIEMHSRLRIEIVYLVIGNESTRDLLLSEYEMSPPSSRIYNKDLSSISPIDKESRGVLRWDLSLTELRCK